MIRRSFFVAGLLPLGSVVAAHPAAAEPSPPNPVVLVRPTPAWVVPAAEEATSFSLANPLGGLAYAIVDRQVRVEKVGVTRFVRVSKHVTSEAGVQQAGQLMFTFSPPHEQLVVHAASVRRGASATSQLVPSAIQVLRRESRLEEQSLDNVRTAMLVLGDVRVGDAIEHAYSVVGSNPVLGGRYEDAFALRLPAPTGVLSFRVLSDRPLGFRAFGGAPDPETKATDGGYEYRLRLERVAGVPEEANVPPEHDGKPWVQIADKASWADVAAWGTKLFRVPSSSSRRVAEAVEAIRSKAETPAARALSVLRMVQNEVRYLAVAFAESTHRPADPETVLERRFGDCKDKSLLAVTLLRALGLDAHVALVSSSRGAKLPELLPNIGVFDHAIVVVEVDGRRHWLDPTILYQRGRLEDVAVRNYHHALVLAPGTVGLTPVEEPVDPRPEVAANAVYRIDRFGGPVALDVTMKATGELARALRALRAVAPSDRLRSVLSEPITKAHSGATPIGEPLILDDEAENVVTTLQSFRLESPWTRQTDGRLLFEVSPTHLVGRLPEVEPDRRSPLFLGMPTRIEQDVRIELPEKLAGSDERYRLPEGGPVEYAYAATRRSTTIDLSYRLAIRQRRVEIDALPAYRDAVAQIEKNFAYHITWAEPVAGSGAWNVAVITFCIVWALSALTHALRTRHHKRSRET